MEKTAGDVFDLIIKHLPKSSTGTDEYGEQIVYAIWTDGQEILCGSEDIADEIADMIDSVAEKMVTCVGYYDPEEDARNKETDFRTGWYYVSMD